MRSSSLISSAFFALAALASPSYGNPPKGCPYITPAYSKEVVSQFEIDQIVPDLIEANVLGHPSVKINVAYGNKTVNLGTYFTTTETVNQPSLNITAERGYPPATTKYSMFLIDPDVPENGSPAQVNFLHWCISDLQPVCITNQSPVQTVIYEPLTPASTTQHRYTFLVYRQPANYTPNTLALQVRSPFDINDYAEDNNLVLVGGNFLKEAIDNGLQG